MPRAGRRLTFVDDAELRHCQDVSETVVQESRYCAPTRKMSRDSVRALAIVVEAFGSKVD